MLYSSRTIILPTSPCLVLVIRLDNGGTPSTKSQFTVLGMRIVFSSREQQYTASIPPKKVEKKKEEYATQLKSRKTQRPETQEARSKRPEENIRSKNERGSR